MHLRPILAGAALATLAAAPAAHAAPTLAALKPCYVAAQPTQRESIAISGTGFTPLALVDVYIDDVLEPTTPGTPLPQAGYNGAITGQVPAPFVDSGQRAFSLRLTEHDAPQNTVTATAQVTRLAVEQVPAKAPTHMRVRFRGRGFTALAPVYAHYVFAGTARRTVLLGMPSGPCGLFSARVRQFPFKKSPRVGLWTIQFDQQQLYDPNAPARVPLTVRVRKTIKPQPAR
jgi:hypothetical protein